MANLKDLIVNGVARIVGDLFVSGSINSPTIKKNNVDVATTSDISSLQSNFQAGVDGIYNAIVAQGTTPSSKSQSDVKNAIGTLSTNRYNNGKTDYNPTGATLTNAGALTVTNAAGTTRLTKTFSNSYDAGNSAGYNSGKTDYNPTEATLGNDGALTVKNAAGTSRLTKTFTNNYNAGYNNGKTDYNPTGATLTNAGALTVTNAAGTSRLTKTFSNSYDAGVTATKKGTAGAAQVLTGYTFTNSSSVGASGSMPNQGAKTASLNTSTTSYTIPAGYHNGSGKISITTQSKTATPTTADQTISPDSGKVLSSVVIKGVSVPAAGNILSGSGVTSNGTTLVSGSMPNQGAKTASLNCGGSYTIPAGYHNGSGKVTANSLDSQTSATAAAGDIVSGKTAYVNGTMITGTITSVEGVTF